MARTHAVALTGMQGHLVQVDAGIENGHVGLLLTGLPDTALRETRDRVRSAIINTGLSWPQGRVTVSLSPASLPKRGPSFDLGIAVAVLAAGRSIRAAGLDGTVFVGELGLDGRLRPVRGVLPAVAAAAAAGFSQVVTAPENLAEAALVPGLQIVAPATLGALVGWLNGRTPASGEAAVQVTETGPGPAARGAATAEATQPGQRERDFADVTGQPDAVRASEICAAGGHHLLLLGLPGTGKTLIAERIPTIMPPLRPAEALEVTAIHSVAGTLTPAPALITQPPFSAPHHTASRAAILGGGTGTIRPGAASLAHHGCLFLDSAPEFDRDVLDALRQPLACGEVVIARSGITVHFPARFILVLAAGPCPCAPAQASGPGCTCTPLARRRYLGRLSGPLLDRIDIRLEMQPVRTGPKLERPPAETSAVIAERVIAARDRAAWRLRATRWRLNAEIPSTELRREYRPEPGALAPLERAIDVGQVSARGADRVIRLSWTLADLAGTSRPRLAEIASALGLWLGAGQ